jgi:hypothetical protein
VPAESSVDGGVCCRAGDGPGSLTCVSVCHQRPCEPAGNVLRDARRAVREAVHLREGVELATVVDQVQSVPLPDRRLLRVVAPVLVSAFRKRRTELLEGRVAVPDARVFAERCVERRRSQSSMSRTVPASLPRFAVAVPVKATKKVVFTLARISSRGAFMSTPPRKKMSRKGPDRTMARFWLRGQ